MRKQQAIELIGGPDGTVADVAEAVGVSPQAVGQWPDELPPRIADRILAVMARRHLPAELLGAEQPESAAKEARGVMV